MEQISLNSGERPTGEYLPIPQPDEIDIREKEDAMGAYLMMFAALGVGLPLPMINVIAAIVYYFVNRNRSPFVKFHCHQSMTSQVSIGLVNAGLMFWTFRNFLYNPDGFNDYYFAYLIFTGIANLVYFIFSVIAAARARKGRFFYFFFFGKWAYHSAYSVAASEKAKRTFVNKPPGS